MEEKQIFKVIDENDVELDAEVLAAFEMEGNEYIIYSTESEDDMANIFAAKLVKNEDGTNEIETIEDEEVKTKITEMIDNIINK